jgi:hypothetical protein
VKNGVKDENFLTRCFYEIYDGVPSRKGKPAAALDRRDIWDASRLAFAHQERLNALHL